MTGPEDPDPDVRYWHEQVAPLVDGRRVRWGHRGRHVSRRVGGHRAGELVPDRLGGAGRYAAIESLAPGTPVVGFARGCLPELVEHGRTGLLVAPGDAAAFGRAIADAVHLQRQDCRVTAAQRFTPDRMADQYLRLYRDVLAHGSGHPSRQALRATASR